MENLQSLNPNRSKKALVVLKSLIVLFILPWIYAFTVAFINESKLIGGNSLESFIAGIISFLIIYLFICEPGKIFQQGQRITEATFRFLSPLIKFASFIVPIYSIIFFVVYILISIFIKSERLLEIFMFLIGFCFALHLIFSAKSLHSRKDDFLMINYLFSFGFIYIINIALLAVGFSILFEAFSWLDFGKVSYQISKGIFFAVFGQLFL
jgi:hypothetical protein